uniref:Uncharacterized protein n=1 Tax=Desertifilum tharense IPPAS B-1220 TaxID=1781255 RepID=A0ACD5GU59_9CYAN
MFDGMLMPASSEFVALCRSQVSLLTEGLGASLSVVYLTEELVEDLPTQLVPIVAHPEVARNWQPERSRTFLPETSGSQPDNLAWHQRPCCQTNQRQGAPILNPLGPQKPP